VALSATGVGSRVRLHSLTAITFQNMKRLSILLYLEEQELKSNLLRSCVSANFFVQTATDWSIPLDIRHSASML